MSKPVADVLRRAHTGETAMESLRRMVRALDYEYESILDDLPSVEAVVEYFALWDSYDTEFLSGIYEAIHAGASVAPLLAFITKHSLTWCVPSVAALRAVADAAEREAP